MYKKYVRSELTTIVAGCNSHREVLLKLNRNESGSSYKVLKRLITEWDIDISHFKVKYEKMFGHKRYDNNEMFIENSIVSRSCIKKRIIDNNLLDYKCIKCGNPGIWMGEKIVLVLDHINVVLCDR
jgi:hypothetical protein